MRQVLNKIIEVKGFAEPLRIIFDVAERTTKKQPCPVRILRV
jgi:hypothetical protein